MDTDTTRVRVRSTWKKPGKYTGFYSKTANPLAYVKVQRALHFSSPSIANHHLEQLRELGLVAKQEVGGHYVLVSEVKIGVLKHYVKLGKLLFPRFFFYGPILHSVLFGVRNVAGNRVYP